MELRKRTHEILEGGAMADRAGKRINLFIQALILLNVVALALETVKSVHDRAPVLFRGFEVLSVAVFSVEYLLRVWSCVHDERFARPLAGRLRFAATPMALIDLLSVLPFYLPFLGMDLRFLRLLRLFRLFRIVKLARYSEALRAFGRVLSHRRAELLSSLFVMLILLVLASTLMYYAENAAQPERFTSVPAAMWWGIATITTVGYGDIYPVTSLGKVLASCIAVIGIAVIALPTSILVAGFLEETKRANAPARTCPHCGKEWKE